MIRSVNAGQMVAQTKSVLFSHPKVVGLVLRGFFEVLRGQSEESGSISRPRRRGGAPFRPALPSHAHMHGDVIRTE
jgi:hypothetical protein